MTVSMDKLENHFVFFFFKEDSKTIVNKQNSTREKTMYLPVIKNK